jgi:N,N-dimethylformamidase
MAEKDSENLKGDKKEQGPSRREFLRLVGLAAGGGALLAANRELLSETAAAAIAPAPIPPHRSFVVPGIHAYADQLSVKPGKTINFFVSSDSTYNLQIYRLGLDPNSPSLDVPMSGVFSYPKSQQPIQPGSYVHVANRLADPNNLTPLTLECWVRPFVGRHYDDFNYSGLITQFDLQNAAGYGLFVRFDVNNVHGGSVAFYLGNDASSNLLEFGIDFLGTKTDWAQLEWHHIVATWDGTTQALWIDGQSRKTQSFPGPVYPTPAPGSASLRLAAFGDAEGKASHFLNGDLAMPVIYNKVLSQMDIQARYNQQFAQQGVQPPALDGSVLACWPLSEEQGSNVADISPYVRPGLIINHATWQIGGPSFKPGEPNVPQFCSYDPSKDPTRGHGLRFASDDLFDCRWQVTQTYTVPANARSGIYVARLSYHTVAGQAAYYHVTFIVQKPDGQKKAPVLLVCPTNTWLAYNSKPFLQKQYQQGSLFEGFLFKETYTSTARRGDVAVDPAPTDAPQYSGYLAHQNFGPGYHFGRLLPNPAADPYVTYATADYSHLTRATRFTQVWLESNHQPYDVISDLDLHTTPDILKNYKTVILAGHSEYWSIPAYNGLKSYLRMDGNLIVLSGDTMYWRVSFSPDGTVMECRKADGAGELVDPRRRGEIWHSDDGLRGGLMRECGFPGWELTGLETFGILNFDLASPGPGNSDFGTFHVKTPKHFLWKGLGVTDGQLFAPNTVGHECDVRVANLEAFRKAEGLGVPMCAMAPVEPLGMTTLALATVASADDIILGFLFDYFLQLLSVENIDRVGEVIYWERPDAGRVFNGGAIANGVALYYNDPVFAGLVRNVLRNFLM